MKILISVCVTVLIFSSFSEAAFMKNKYSVDIESVDRCPDVPQNKIKNLKFIHYNRTHKALSYDFEYEQPLDEKIGGNIVAAKWGDGGWIVIPFIGFQKNICQFMLRHFKAYWIPFHALVGVTHPDRCPIPAGNYSLKDYVIDTTDMTNVPFFNGRFRFMTTFQNVDTKEVITCIAFVLSLTELF